MESLIDGTIYSTSSPKLFYYRSVFAMSAANGKETCLSSPCNGKGPLTSFEAKAVSKIVASSREKGDDMYSSLLLEVQAHESCYCNYTSNSRYIKFAKRNAAAESSDAGGKRQLKSNVRDFDFNRDCLLCGQVCV